MLTISFQTFSKVVNKNGSFPLTQLLLTACPGKMPERRIKCSGGFALHCHAEGAFFQWPR